MDFEQSTIAAISTPVGAGGISIVRISGAEAEKICREIFLPAKTSFPLKTHRAYLGELTDNINNKTIDQVLCLFMKGPATYTTEDVVEFHCHGGTVVAAKVLDIVLKNGAILAQPGEFTKRAFLGGRIDLSQAEAVCELIGAKGRTDSELALAQLKGGITERIENITKPLIQILARIEAAIDYPDDDVEIIDPEWALNKIECFVIPGIKTLLEAYQSGRTLREGIKAAIVGKPNVGKSSLFNALVRSDRAIVTEHAGTTRDLIEAEASFGGIPVTLIDTAGLENEPADAVEMEGQKRAVDRLKSADIVLFVIDGSQEISEEDRRIYEIAENRTLIMVVNKIDLDKRANMNKLQQPENKIKIAEVSAKGRQGIDDLSKMIFEIVTEKNFDNGSIPEIVPNARHKKALNDALIPLKECTQGIRNGASPDILAFELGQALDKIGLITGKTTPDDVLDEIFSTFCLGK